LKLIAIKKNNEDVTILKLLNALHLFGNKSKNTIGINIIAVVTMSNRTPTKKSIKSTFGK